MVANVVFAALGAAIGVLPRSPAVAIGLALGWMLIGEQIVGSLTSFADWLPGQLCNALVDGTLTATGAVALAAWVGTALLVAGWVFHHRDVS